MKKFDLITDGKFTGVVGTNFSSTWWQWYFGIYNHQYFAFLPEYSVDTMDSVSKSTDFRKVTEKEKDEFLKDCEKLGHPYDPKSHEFIGYPLSRKKGFLSLQMPRYSSFGAMSGKTVKDQFIDNGKLFWIFTDNTWTYIQTDYDIEDINFLQITSERDLIYDDGDSWPGERLITFWWDANRDFETTREDDIVMARTAWWYFANYCIEYNFYKPENDLSDVFKKKDFTKFGKKFIDAGLIKADELYLLAKEYQENRIFHELHCEIQRIQRQSKKSKFNIV